MPTYYLKLILLDMKDALWEKIEEKERNEIAEAKMCIITWRDTRMDCNNWR